MKINSASVDSTFTESEIQLQARCFQWAHNTYPGLRKLLFAVPNGGYRNKREAGQLKASGVIAGVPDMICLYGARPVGIEMKTIKGTTSDAQKALHPVWIRAGIPVHVCRSLEEFQEVIKGIINTQTSKQ